MAAEVTAGAPLAPGEIPAEAEEDQPASEKQAGPDVAVGEPELRTAAEDVPSEQAVPAASPEADQPPEQEPGAEPGAEQHPPEQQQETTAAEDGPGEDQAAAGAEPRPATGQPELLTSDPAPGIHDGPADGQGVAEQPGAAVPEPEPAEDHAMMADQPEEPQAAAFPAAEELPLDPATLPTLSSSGLSIRQYLDTTVVPVLRLGLRELVKARPTDPFDFLADFIRDNKPK